MKLLIFTVLTILVGCATLYTTTYNIEDHQDSDCYRNFGGEQGYCDGSKAY